MTAENCVDAALSGLDLGESATLPSVEDYKLWLSFEGARRGLPTVPSNPAINPADCTSHAIPIGPKSLAPRARRAKTCRARFGRVHCNFRRSPRSLREESATRTGAYCDPAASN